MRKSILVGIVTLVSAFTISACSADKEDANHENMGKNSHSEENMGMDHSGSGEVPEGLKVAESPTFEVGTKAIIKTDHMEGMSGAEATIVGAYDTTAYAISYNPTTGGERVTNHKWVIQEEVTDAGVEILKPGTEVQLEAEHMKGMEGATAEIDFSEETTVYMIDYTPTTGGAKVTNHKWVTESELIAK